MKIIAEIGSNWRTLDDCLMSIDKAKECGADIVKFQMFNPQELYGPNAGHMIELGNYALKEEWIPGLYERACNIDIEFMCTAFSVPGYQIVNPYVSRHKVASSEMVDFQLLDYLNITGKEVLLSTAGANITDEIRIALLHLKDVPVTIMHCVGDYPAKTYNYEKLYKLYETYGDGYEYGMSDHSMWFEPGPKWVVLVPKEKPIKYYEKHVTFIQEETPDQPHSLTYDEFKYFCMALRYEYIDSSYLCNKDMNKLYRRRVIATREILPGETLELGVNIGIYRPITPSEDHVPPLLRHLYQGKECKRIVAVGETIKLADV